MKRLVGLLLLASTLVLVVGTATASGDEPKPDAGMAGKRSVAPGHKARGAGTSYAFECNVTSSAPNVNLDCDDPFPNNEPDVVVDPANPKHMIASSNDYGSCCDQFYTTFDGGHMWVTGNMSIEDAKRTGSDPVTAIDRKTGTALHSSLNYTFNAAGETCDGDLVASPSQDGGVTWGKPAVVDGGQGCDSSPLQFFNDKEWITADASPSSPHFGRVYVTWTKFESHSGDFFRSAIFVSHSDDGGKHWSKAQEVSGSNPAICTVQVSGPAGQCDEDQFSEPVVAPDGTVYVVFENSQNASLDEPGESLEDQYLIVKSSDGGTTWSSPAFVAGLEDGSHDYPNNADGNQALTGYQARLDSAGNLAISLADGKLYLVFSDNRAGVHDSSNPVTNANVSIVSSSDGTHWSRPEAVDSSRSDQWFPWVDVNPVDGTVGV